MAATTFVGLDIGATAARAVEATVERGRPVVGKFGQAALPPGAVAGGVVLDDKVVTSALRQLWTDEELTARDVVLGVTHQQVVVREFDVPNLPPKELRQALPYLVRDSLPLPVDEAALDFYPLNEVTPGKQDTVTGLVVAAPKAAVINTVRAVEAAGLHVVQVDLASFAVLRACAHLAHDTEAVVDLGASSTNIVIHTDGTPKIVRTIPRGGDEVTRRLSERLDISTLDAERVKRRHGLRPVTDGAQTAEGADLAESAEIVADTLRPIVNEIRGSLGYFASAHPAARVTRLALVGGASLLPGLADELTLQLGIPTFLSDPLQRITRLRKQRQGQVDTLGRFRSAAAVSVGLTLGAA